VYLEEHKIFFAVNAQSNLFPGSMLNCVRQQIRQQLFHPFTIPISIQIALHPDIDPKFATGRPNFIGNFPCEGS